MSSVKLEETVPPVVVQQFKPSRSVEELHRP